MSTGTGIQICAVVVILGYCIWRVIRALIRISKRKESGGCCGCSLADACTKPTKTLSDSAECKKSDKDLHNSNV